MLKRIFFLFLAFAVLLTLCVFPASAEVVTSENMDQYLSEAMLSFETDSYYSNFARFVDFNGSGFPSYSISYPAFGGSYLYDVSGYVFYFKVRTDEIPSTLNVWSYLGGTTGGGPYYMEYPTSFECGEFTYFYRIYTFLNYADIFGSGQFPNYVDFNFSSQTIGEFSSFVYGYSSASDFYLFRQSVDAYYSYLNGAAEGSVLLSSPFFSSDLSLSYYYQGTWINIPITVPDLTDYITATTVNLNILQNLGIDSADIPSNNGGLRLCFTLPYAINMSAFSFGAFNPNNLVRTYDPADIRSERFGVWFNNTISNFSLWPLRSIAEGNTYTYDYNFPPNRALYNQICIELNENALRSILASNTPVSDYVSYRLVDFNATYGSGYDAGYDVGYGQGEQNGYNNGKQQGYLEGKAEGLQMAQNGDFFSLFSALIDAPVSAFTNLLSFEIFNQNVASFVLSILSLILVFKIVKVVI